MIFTTVKSKMEKGLSVQDFPIDAVISISSFGESPKRAIRSVLRYPKRFKALHIVQHGYSTTHSFYKGWSEDLQLLKRNGLDPIWHSKLDPDKLVSQAVIHIEPDLQVKDGALDLLCEDMKDNNKWNSHFAVSSITCLETVTNWKDYASTVFYGFIVVLAVFDSLRSFFNGFRYHRTVDLRGQTTYTTFPKKVELAPTRWWTWLLFTRTNVLIKGGSALLQIPTYADRGFNFVLRTIQTHRHLGIGIWIPWFFVYYMFFAWPWWSPIFAHYKIPYLTKVFGWILEREPPFYWIVEWTILGRSGVHFNPAWQILHFLHLIMVGFITWMYVVLPPKMGGGIVIMYPIYLMFAPLLFLYGQFHVSRNSWIIEDEDEIE